MSDPVRSHRDRTSPPLPAGPTTSFLRRLAGQLLDAKNPAEQAASEAEGEITGDEIVISQGALVTARIAASRITIAGTVNGEITAREKVEVLAAEMEALCDAFIRRQYAGQGR